MPVTEFSILHLKPSISRHDAQLLNLLLELKRAMESFTSTRFHYFYDRTDEDRIYIFGQWTSVEVHVEEWIPSVDNQWFLKVLDPFLTIEEFFHVDVATTQLPLDADEVAVERWTVPADKTEEFQARVMTAQEFGKWTGYERLQGGWRIEKESEDSEKEEFVYVRDSQYSKTDLDPDSDRRRSIRHLVRFEVGS